MGNSQSTSTGSNSNSSTLLKQNNQSNLHIFQHNVDSQNASGAQSSPSLHARFNNLHVNNNNNKSKNNTANLPSCSSSNTSSITSTNTNNSLFSSSSLSNNSFSIINSNSKRKAKSKDSLLSSSFDHKNINTLNTNVDLIEHLNSVPNGKCFILHININIIRKLQFFFQSPETNAENIQRKNTNSAHKKELLKLGPFLYSLKRSPKDLPNFGYLLSLKIILIFNLNFFLRFHDSSANNDSFNIHAKQ
jgi:hypothetical protein